LPESPLQIRLQTTVTPFYDSFVEFLPVVEKAMIDHGLDPRDFIIAKDRTQFNSFPGLRQRFHNYTVSVKGQDFTVMQPTDLSFLKYFYDRCIDASASNEKEIAGARTPKEYAATRRSVAQFRTCLVSKVSICQNT
jgi:hypothetical protein